MNHQIVGQTLLLLGGVLVFSAIRYRSTMSLNAGLRQTLPKRLDKAVKQSLRPNEKVVVSLKGAFMQALICTDSRVLIVKGGWLTGQIFGTNIFQLPYASVAGCEVKFSLLTGWFEISSGGMQNLPRKFWSRDENTSPARAPNCVSLISRSQATAFRNACSLILEQQSKTPASGRGLDAAAATIRERLRELTQMHNEKLITEDEYLAKRSALLQQL